MSAASVWDSPELTNGLGDRLADDLRQMVREHESGAERSQQRDLGPSEIANPCTRCLARKVLGIGVVRQFDDPWCRILGTAGHAWLDEAAATSNVRHDDARWIPEMRVQPHPDLLPRGGRADLYDKSTKTVVDHKIVGLEPLRKYRLNGPGQQYRGQGHLYGLGYHRAGHEVRNVAVAFWPRGGRLSDLYVWSEPFDKHYAIEILDRYRTIREQALAIGAPLIPLLPADPSCWDCGGRDVTPSADPTQGDVTQPNQGVTP